MLLCSKFYARWWGVELEAVVLDAPGDEMEKLPIEFKFVLNSLNNFSVHSLAEWVDQHTDGTMYWHEPHDVVWHCLWEDLRSKKDALCNTGYGGSCSHACAC